MLPGKGFVRDCIRSFKRIVPPTFCSVRDYGREAEMAHLYRSGETLEEIGQKFDLTRERVRQILRRDGLSAALGGRAARCVNRARVTHEERLAKLQRRALDLFGVPVEVVCAIAGIEEFADMGRLIHRHPILKAYHNQMRSARVRRIPWQFTLATWWDLWRDSGHWHERGRGHGYCMARWADEGPYSLENVYITTNAENVKHGYIVKPAAMRAAKAKVTREAKNF